MADQPLTPSGSRWEPDPERPDASYDAPDITPDITPEAGPADAPGVDEPAADERRAQLRSRAVLAGAATVLALGAGVTGFVIGHSTAGNGADTVRQAGFTGQQDGGQLGGQPGQGLGHDGDRGGDGDHGFGQPPQGSTGGGSSANSSGTGAGTTGNPT